LGATVDASYTGRAQVILVVTGIETQSLEGVRTDLAFRRPITSKVRASEPVTEAPEPQPDHGDLAVALFSQAVAAADKPADMRNPAPAGVVTPHSGASAAASSAVNLDLPAFLRRRRGSFGDQEGA
jgi:hypothetical protein